MLENMSNTVYNLNFIRREVLQHIVMLYPDKGQLERSLLSLTMYVRQRSSEAYKAESLIPVKRLTVNTCR